MKQLDMQHIARELRQGKESAFDAIYSAYSRKIYAAALRILRSEEDALEVVQETFLKLWVRRSEIDPDKSIEGYLSTIARNYSLKLLSSRVHMSYLDTLPETAEAADQPLLKEEFQARIRQAIDKLPPRAREILLLSREQGLSNQQIADKLDLSLSTVNNHIHSALTKIKTSLEIPVTLLICLLGMDAATSDVLFNTILI